jgi:hypothetical protein
MKNLIKVLLVLVTALFVAGILASSGSEQVQAQTGWPAQVPVRVTHPLPVPVDGSVRASQSGPWSVNANVSNSVQVSGAVAASQAGTWNVNATLTNQPIAVEPLVSVDPRALNAVGGTLRMLCEGGSADQCQNFTTGEDCTAGPPDACLLFEAPPAGTILVIEHIAVSASVFVGGGAVLSLLVSQPSISPGLTVGIQYDLPISYPDAAQSAAVFARSLPVRIYSLGPVRAFVSRFSSGSVDTPVLVSSNGYLVPL